LAARHSSRSGCSFGRLPARCIWVSPIRVSLKGRERLPLVPGRAQASLCRSCPTGAKSVIRYMPLRFASPAASEDPGIPGFRAGNHRGRRPPVRSARQSLRTGAVCLTQANGTALPPLFGRFDEDDRGFGQAQWNSDSMNKFEVFGAHPEGQFYAPRRGRPEGRCCPW
jgi:hypothetical protein